MGDGINSVLFNEEQEVARQRRLGRCWGCIQENCKHGPCDCSCHKENFKVGDAFSDARAESSYADRYETRGFGSFTTDQLRDELKRREIAEVEQQIASLQNKLIALKDIKSGSDPK